MLYLEFLKAVQLFGDASMTDYQRSVTILRHLYPDIAQVTVDAGFNPSLGCQFGTFLDFVRFNLDTIEGRLTNA